MRQTRHLKRSSSSSTTKLSPQAQAIKGLMRVSGLLHHLDSDKDVQSATSKSTPLSLTRKYFDPRQPGAFSSKTTFARELRKQGHRHVTSSMVAKNLASHDAFTLHQPKQKPFTTRVVVSSPGYQWQADLCDMQRFSKFNKGYRFILTAVDCFSRMLYAVAVRSKRGADIEEALRYLFEKVAPKENGGHGVPVKIQTDMGKEFYNSQVASLFKKITLSTFPHTTRSPSVP